MLKYAILAQLEAKPGKEVEAEQFLRGALPFVQKEGGTVHWYGFRTGKSSFAIFDTFETEACRDAHMSGAAAKRLAAVSDELFAKVTFEMADLVAVKQPD
jgi:quinol monooxygenase YgiN